MFFRVFGAALVITIIFWLPRVIARAGLRRILGRRYPAVYLIYTANSPGLFLALKG